MADSLTVPQIVTGERGRKPRQAWQGCLVVDDKVPGLDTNNALLYIYIYIKTLYYIIDIIDYIIDIYFINNRNRSVYILILCDIIKAFITTHYLMKY